MKTAEEWLTKPKDKGITDKEWSIYLQVGILAACPYYEIPIGMTMYEIYSKVDKIMNPPEPPKLKELQEFKGFKSCVKRTY